MIADRKKPTIYGEFEDLADDVDQWSVQKTDEDEGDQVPLHAIKVITSVEQFVEDEK